MTIVDQLVQVMCICRVVQLAMMLFLVACVSSSIAEGRTWKDTTGKFSVEAELVEQTDQAVVLKRADGSTITVPIARLSDADRQFLQVAAASRVKLGPAVSFPKAGVSIAQPEDFFEVENFEGFYNEEKQGSIVATRLPDAYADAVRAFEPATLKAGGMTLQSRETVETNGRTGLWLQVAQPAGDQVYSKWILAFGDDRQCLIITGMCPQEHAGELASTLKAAVLSTKLTK